MSKWDKLLTRICTLSKDLRFDELRKEKVYVELVKQIVESEVENVEDVE